MTVAGPTWSIEDPPPPVATSGRPLSVRGQRTRARLLDAAETVFTDLGYPDASVVKITEAAGVAQGTFYLYFGSKQQVFDELIVELNRRVRHAMTVGASQGRTRVERERGGFAAFFRFTAEHPGLYRIIRQAEFVSPAMFHYHYERVAAGYLAGLKEAMDSGEIVEADPEVLAYALMGIGEIIGLRWILWGYSKHVPDDVFDQMHAFITRALGASDATP